MVARKIRQEQGPEAQETPLNEQEAVVLAEEVEVSREPVTPLDIESRRLEHQRRIKEGGK